MPAGELILDWEWSQNRQFGLLLHWVPHGSQHQLAALSPPHCFVL